MRHKLKTKFVTRLMIAQYDFNQYFQEHVLLILKSNAALKSMKITCSLERDKLN